MGNSIKSNLEYLKNQTGTISATISTALSNCSGGSDSFASTTLCPSAEPAVVAAFLKCYQGMLNTLSKEMETINEIGDGFDSLDNAMAGIATTLSVDLKSVAASPVTLLTFEPKADFATLTNNLGAMIVASGLDKDAFAPKQEKQAPTGYYPPSGGGATQLGYTPPTKTKPEEQSQQSEQSQQPVNEPVTSSPPTAQTAYQPTPTTETTNKQPADLQEQPEVKILDVTVETKDEIPVDNPVNDVTQAAPTSSETSEKKSPMGTIGAIAGIGLAGAAAAAYGINKYKQNQDLDGDEALDEEDDEEFGGDE